MTPSIRSRRIQALGAASVLIVAVVFVTLVVIAVLSLALLIIEPIPGVLLLLVVLILAVVLRPLVRLMRSTDSDSAWWHSNLARGVCPSCGYSTRGISAAHCPECGQQIRTPPNQSLQLLGRPPRGGA
jgi:uncharacterized paraquat-inducible protein A